MMAVDAQGNEVGKLFVGGLHQSTTNDSLKAYFSQFGDIEESIVMMDNRTGRSRGFGYIKFKENTTVDSVLAQKPHVIDQKEVDPKRCNVNMKGKNRRSLKVFVGGIAFEHDEATIRSFFSKYGRVTDVNLLTSPDKQRHRGFAFVGFDDEEVVRNLIRLHYLNIDGKQVEVKAMEPPISQRVGYPSFPGGPLPQANGRAVRGGRNNHFTQVQPNDSYAPWNQWAGVGGAGWNPTGCPPGPNPPWVQPAVGWNTGDGTGAVANHQGPQSGTGATPHISNLGHTTGVGWPDQQGAASNGWMPSGWGAQVPGSTMNNGVQNLSDEIFFNAQPQQQRKPRPTWDSLCYQALTSGTNSVANPGELVSSLENWNHSTAAANALCHLAPLQMGSGLTANATGGSEWNQVNTPGSGSNHHWTGHNSSVPMTGTNANSQGGAGANGLQGGFLNDHSAAPHQNGAVMAAVAAAAAAFRMTGSGGTALTQWPSAPGHGDPGFFDYPVDPSNVGNLKLDEALYRSAGGYGLASASGPPNHTPGGIQHPSANGLMPGDWRAVASHPGAGANSVPGFHPTSQQHLYKR
ncbi:RNA-binding protein Musashi [Paragonimus westermani]|uniref:RNA-binding protein Musashi n=1 Tax=Paragonimus westermani TaxID=34504 RepID=A0A5J4N8Z3_9TREM|nr:RNA-binding protein Musashi [Paragonimus westermani]